MTNVPDELEHPAIPEYKQMISTCKQMEKQMWEQITGIQRKALEKYLVELMIKNSFEQKEYFIMGMKMGICLMIDCLK